MRRQTVALPDVLKRILPEEVKKRVYSIEMIGGRWEGVVGPELARRSEPEALANGVLTVRVTDAAWGRMITKLEGRIIPALNRAVGASLVQRINFHTRRELRTVRPPVARKNPPAAEPPPETIQRAAESISNSELREIVMRSAANYLRARRERRRN